MDKSLMDLTPAPYFAEIAEGPETGQAHWATTDDGLRIRIGHWLPTGDEPVKGPVKGTVLIFPGRTEYVEKYGPAAADFNQRGYAALAVDWRGQGLGERMLADRRLGHVEEFGDFQKDVAAVVKLAKQLKLPEPWYLLGHSMGGAIGLRALMEGLPVKACAFSAPMWGILIPNTMKPVARVLGGLAPVLGMGDKRVPTTTQGHYVETAPFKGNTLTNDPAMYQLMIDQLKAQPDLVLGGPTINWLSEGLKECETLAERPSPVLPCLTFLGAQEQIVNSAAVKDRMARWPGGELDLIDPAQHEIVMEGQETRRRGFDKMTQLFDQYR
ncbi:alpha/beta hydrolase [Pseudophaeobacter sp.]|uniref:alpha/beta fold hydrolase n=1 Tax=Pseudophaeobacter sp. TaxID=1971739 RepID=UPI00262D4269|nr:alpha/beta hydrolase [Pseudophaeobacter sp.]